MLESQPSLRVSVMMDFRPHAQASAIRLGAALIEARVHRQVNRGRFCFAKSRASRNFCIRLCIIIRGFEGFTSESLSALAREEAARASSKAESSAATWQSERAKEKRWEGGKDRGRNGVRE
eukprot:3260213-Rhodomonas_salina.3